MVDISKLSASGLKSKGAPKSRYANQEEFNRVKGFFLERDIPRYRIASALEVSYPSVLNWWKDGIPQKRFEQLLEMVKEIEKWEEEHKIKFK